MFVYSSVRESNKSANQQSQCDVSSKKLGIMGRLVCYLFFYKPRKNKAMEDEERERKRMLKKNERNYRDGKRERYIYI